MSRASVLARGRAAAAVGMVDACIIRRQTSTTTDATGHDTPTWTDVYGGPDGGPCKVQESSGLPRDANPTPEAPVLMVYRQLHLPVDTSAGVLAGDVAEMTVCVHDPDLVGRKLVIRAERTKSFATARRLDVEEVTG